MSDLSPFMKKYEIEGVHPVNDPTRKRAERAGIFPKRIWLGPKVAAWRRTEINDWFADPAGWAQRNRTAGEKSALDRAADADDLAEDL
jgi:predicted DNA-binding transcriptional regulator AlpA